MGAEGIGPREEPSWEAVDDGLEQTVPPGWGEEPAGEVEPVEDGYSIGESPDDV